MKRCRFVTSATTFGALILAPHAGAQTLPVLSLPGATATANVEPAIFAAVASGDAAKVSAALQADPKAANARNRHGQTALANAIRASNIALVQPFIDAKADLNATERDGDRPLQTALNYGQ